MKTTLSTLDNLHLYSLTSCWLLQSDCVCSCCKGHLITSKSNANISFTKGSSQRACFKATELSSLLVFCELLFLIQPTLSPFLPYLVFDYHYTVTPAISQQGYEATEKFNTFYIYETDNDAGGFYAEVIIFFSLLFNHHHSSVSSWVLKLHSRANLFWELGTEICNLLFPAHILLMALMLAVITLITFHSSS